MLTSELLAAYLVSAGAEIQFGVVGEGNLAVVTALDELGVPYVPARREDAAVSMADGWARRAGRTGFVSVTSGPGFTNAITALIEAVRHGTPLVVIVSLTPDAALHHPQRLDARSLAEVAGAGWRRTRGPEHLAEDVREVCRAAAVEQRPQVLAVPQDQLYLPVDGLLLDGSLPAELPTPLTWDAGAVRPDPAAVARLRDLLGGARRPLLLAGRGSIRSGATAAITELAEHLGAPLATSLLAKGAFREHPHHLGIFGGFATRHGSEVIPSADLVLALGASLNPWQTMRSELTDGATVVQVDLDPDAIGRWQPVDLGIVGDVGATVDAVLSLDLGGARTSWFPTAATGTDLALEATAPFATRDVVTTLATHLPEATTLAFDSGHAMGDLIPELEVSGPERFVYGLHAGSIGLGLGLALGAALAARDEWTVLFVGDGALSMSLQELDTLRRLDLPLVVVVLDDGGYGAEVHYSAARGLPDDHAATDNPDYVEVAGGFGLAGHRVERLEDLSVVARILAGERKPALVHVPIDPRPMNRWYESFAAGIEPVGWGGLR